ncbi:MAG TPA: hypothetical protein VK660_06720 [Xanthomonadaceae bacterium]|jgi:hypothetical protein|nr:hypothetical protein [Xanthomonadaceae bacterium]
MADLRNLLLDCRSALRRASRQFDEDPLRAKLDEALNELSKNVDDDVLEQPETRTAQQVAYAWQIATRSVKLTHPDLYAKLSRRVTDMLNANVLDPATEFQLLEAKLASASAAHQATTKELADLRQLLAEAVPLVGRDAFGSDAECAQRRVAVLVNAALQGISTPKPIDAAPMNDDPQDQSHTRDDLLAVAQGRRQLSSWERSWCLAEAMVMSEMSASQLKQLKDIDLARLVVGEPAALAAVAETPASSAS